MPKNECCQDESNLGPEERLEAAPEGEYFRRCQVCQSRHFIMVIDPVEIKVTLTEPWRRRAGSDF